jgi:hypothetical protein
MFVLLNSLLLLGSAPASAAECTSTVSRAQLEAAVVETENAWKNVEDDKFRDGLNTLAGLLLPCTGESVSPQIAARIHLLMGLNLQANGDAENALASARASRSADPAFVPAPELLPVEHPLHVVWTEGVGEANTTRAPDPKVGSLSFDGVVTREHAPGQPAILQIFDDTGFARSTTYLGVGEGLPAYEAVPHRRNLLLGCTVGAGVLGAGAYALAWNTRGGLYGAAAVPDTNPGDLETRRNTTNALAIVSTTLLGTAIGCGTGAALIGQQ